LLIKSYFCALLGERTMPNNKGKVIFVFINNSIKC
jgi:hypothetical protein